MIPHPISASAAWTAAGWTMLHLVWIGAVGGVVVAMLRRLLRPARPETRHGAAVACLLALSASPVVLFVRLYRPDPPTGSASVQPGRVASTDARASVDTTPLPALDLRRPGVDPLEPPPVPVSSRFEPMVGYLPGLWLSGSMVTLALLATGLVGVERLRRSSRPLEAGAIEERCRVLTASLGVARRVGVAICDRIAAPILIGVIRPLILLPPAALGGWSIEQVEMALLHELAHIRRHDNLVTLLQRLAESLLFFHPVTWWLSAWVSLERELCCDRLVVERTGRPHDYARMLAALAGAGPGAQSMALAMARRPLTTRIRRILDMEDRSMKMTLSEGLGLLAAALVGTTLTWATHAGPPRSVPPDAARQTLERMAKGVVALPDSQDAYEGKGFALLQIAQAQLKLGDRAATLATLRLLDDIAAPRPPKPGAKADIRAWERFAAMAESAGIRRDAGDPEGARATLDRSARYLDVLDAGAIRGSIDRVSKEMDTLLATRKDDSPQRLSDEEAAMVCEVSVVLIDQCLVLGDNTLARTLIGRTLEAVGPPRGPLKAVLVGLLGGYLVRAGDADGGRALIERARQATLALTDSKARAFVVPTLAHALFDAGDIDGAMAMVRQLPTATQPSAFGKILDGLSTNDQSGAWYDAAGIDLKIGDPWRRPKDPAAARIALPKIAAGARTVGDARVQARTLAIVAHLQARAGDIPGALATARSMPILKRSDFPGPSDGFYDAVKPVTFALIAGAQAEAGEKSAAVATLGEAETLARAVAAEDQKLIALSTIAQNDVTCGRRDAAIALVAEAIPLALAQPDPRRSRVLTMFMQVQVQAGDVAGALRTIDAIRDYPGLEKVRALSVLARHHEEAGDAGTSERLLRRAAACLDAKAPEKPLPGKVATVKSFGRDTFMDIDLEVDPSFLQFQRNSMVQTLRARIGDVDAAVRAARALPAAPRDAALSQIAGSLAQRGDVARAMDLASSIESPQARLGAFMTLANVIPQRQAKK
jgi:beta-lactamase regulating signal transducer with metallopeptidase domain